MSLGSVTWGDPPVVATLLGPARWRATLGDRDRPDLAATLAERYRDFPGGPAEGAYGYRILSDLAASVGGAMTWDVPPREPDDASD